MGGAGAAAAVSPLPYGDNGFVGPRHRLFGFTWFTLTRLDIARPLARCVSFLFLLARLRLIGGRLRRVCIHLLGAVWPLLARILLPGLTDSGVTGPLFPPQLLGSVLVSQYLARLPGPARRFPHTGVRVGRLLLACLLAVVLIPARLLLARLLPGVPFLA